MKLKVVSVLGILALLILVGCTSKESNTNLSNETAQDTPTEQVLVKLNWRPGVQHMGLYAAQGLGYYAEEGMEVVLEPLFDSNENNDLPEKVANGNYDFSLGGSNLINGQARGVEVVSFATMLQLSPKSFFVKADSGIVSPGDFSGQTGSIPCADF